MQKSFWHQKWQNNDIGFHCAQPHPLLVENLHRLNLSKGDRVFLPLCGKTLDIHWLLAQGYRVVGVELIPMAIEQLFQELGVEPKRSTVGALELFQTEGLDLFVGDLFELTKELLGQVNAVYDRAAMVALPSDVRKNYAAHLQLITETAPQLLICFDYDQSKLDGPPFSVPQVEIEFHYKNAYQVSLVKSVTMPEKLKGKCNANENLWLLNQK